MLNPIKTKNIMTRGQFIRVEKKIEDSERLINDRRKSLRGNPSKSEVGEERRKEVRRQEDVLILLEIDDSQNIFKSHEAFYQMIQRTINRQIVNLVSKEKDKEKLIDLEFGHKKVLIETRFKYRDIIKRLFTSKGLHCELIKIGVQKGKILEKLDKAGLLQSNDALAEKVNSEIPVEAALIPFTPEQIIQENENIVVKVFARCLDIVHPTDGDWEREAMKQTVDLEHKIIFMTEKHYKNAEKISYKNLIDQVVEELITKSFDLTQIQGEKAKLEEKYRLSSDASTMAAINRLNEKITAILNSPLIETSRVFYIYLDYFKDVLMVSNKRGKILNNIPQLAKNSIEALSFREINEIINFMAKAAESIARKRPANMSQQLKKISKLRSILAEEIYYIQFLWHENLLGKKKIWSLFEKTKQSINI
ncbi:MAG: hypothetical protein HOD92_04355 [Deltaproteobacteria bacterium]|nr:hypothetical protein [Deltaproteobacteria bacterium]